MKFNKLINEILHGQLDEAYNISYEPSEERTAYVASVTSVEKNTEGVWCRWRIHPVSKVQFDDGVSQWYDKHNAIYCGKSSTRALQVFADAIKVLMPGQSSTLRDVIDEAHKLPNPHERGLWMVGDVMRWCGHPWLYIGVEIIPAQSDEGLRDVMVDDTTDEEGSIMDL